MKIRTVAASALALTLAVGLTGCNLISPQRTTMRYDASDGVSVDLDGVYLRDVLLITNADGSEANIMFAGYSGSNTNAQVAIDVDGQTSSVQMNAAPGKLTQVGFGQGGQHLISGNFTGGSTVEVKFSASFTTPAGAQQTAETTKLIPVLGDKDMDSVLKEYQTLIPTPTPQAPVTPTEAPEA